jgi:thiamine biosynthesis lipoprotein ApbE
VAPTAERADVLAKVAFLLGAADGSRSLDGRPGIGGVLVARDGRVRVVGELELSDA